MINYIQKPNLVNSFKDHVPGKIKFFKESIGFITLQDGSEAFFHRDWLCTTIVAGVGDIKISFYPRLNAPKTGEIVCCRIVQNERGPQAHEIVNAVEAAFIQRELLTTHAETIAAIDKLVPVRVHVLEEEYKYRSDNKKHTWVKEKVGERKKLIFEGTDFNVLNKLLETPYIRTMLLKPDVRLIEETLVDGEWREYERT